MCETRDRVRERGRALGSGEGGEGAQRTAPRHHHLRDALGGGPDGAAPVPRHLAAPRLHGEEDVVQVHHGAQGAVQPVQQQRQQHPEQLALVAVDITHPVEFEALHVVYWRQPLSEALDPRDLRDALLLVAPDAFQQLPGRPIRLVLPLPPVGFRV